MVKSGVLQILCKILICNVGDCMERMLSRFAGDTILQGNDWTAGLPLRETSTIWRKGQARSKAKSQYWAGITPRTSTGWAYDSLGALLPKRPWVLFYNKLNGISGVPLQQRWPTTSRAVLARVQPAGPRKGSLCCPWLLRVCLWGACAPLWAPGQERE